MVAVIVRAVLCAGSWPAYLLRVPAASVTWSQFSWVAFARSLSSAPRQRCSGVFEFIAHLGLLFRGPSPLVSVPSIGWPNNALVPTAQSLSRLGSRACGAAAAQRGRYASKKNRSC